MSTSTPFRPSPLAQSSYAPRPPTSANTTLSSLLAQANSLSRPSGTDGSSELPQIRYGIDEIERMSEAVAGKGKGRSGQGRLDGGGGGLSLLSELGVQTAGLNHSIGQMTGNGSVGAAEGSSRRRRRRPFVSSSRPADVSGDVPMDGDVGTWGRNYHETIILAGIELQRQRTVKAFNQQFQQRMLDNWEAEKARVLQDELGVTDDEIARIAGVSKSSGSGLGRSLGASTSARRFPMAAAKATESRDGGLVMHTKMIRYERVISELNHARLRKEPYELCQALARTVEGDSKYPQLSSTLTLLAHLVHEPSLRDGDSSDLVLERQYASAYLGDPRSSQAALLRGRLVQGGRRFLERDFEKHMDETIAKHPKEASLGGLPGARNKVRAYVDVLLKGKEVQENYRPELVNGIPLFAQVYYLLRSGYPAEALELLADHQTALSPSDAALPGALKSYVSSADRRLSKTQRDQLAADFNAHLRSNASADQYKFAIYKLIGRFELNRKNLKVAGTTEDWTWLQLTLVRDSKEGGREDTPQDQYDLVDLARMMVRFGNEKFDANGTRPLAWAQLLLFSGQFERAVAYLYTKQALKTDAVHLAIALAYYGLLRVPYRGDDVDILTIDDTGDREVCTLNLSRILKAYISPFASLEPQTALQYAYLVALSSDAPDGIGERQKQLCLELVRDVVLASRAWSKLLGAVRADGTKEPGLIESSLPLLKLTDRSDGEYMKHIVLSAAEQSSLDASLLDSVELYHLAGAGDKVVETINRALAASLSSGDQTINGMPGSGQGQGGLGLSSAFGGSNDLYSLAQKVHAVYERDLSARSHVPRGAWETLGILLLLRKAFGEWSAERPDLCLATLQSTGLLPLSSPASSDPSASIAQSTSAFKALLDQPTIGNLDEVIILSMKCLHRLSQALRQSSYADAGRQRQLDEWRGMAGALVSFAGGLRLRLGSEVYRSLSSMSAFF